MENTIKLSEQDYKTIEESVKKIAEENKIESVEEVSIKLSKESGLVFFKEAILDMIEKKADYSGWSNYETWNAALWINNDEGLYDEISHITRRSHDVHDLAEEIKNIVMEGKPEIGNNMFSDLLTNAVGSINWRELAESFKKDDEDIEDDTVREII